jgi:hypothetical protein
MIVNVIITRADSIPRTAEVTGVPEEEIRKNFDECQKFGKPYVFSIIMSEEQFKTAEEMLNNGG